ncbi:Cyclic di-GMP regulator CdgR [Serratia fonticola]|uniref:Cyclic di-GMP regulator CdgR n=1 Tax=Serratia fonticola TaxID=47917 RepID=A0A4U9WEX4_SERFO|nr:Cyclic di-GMP regulator CdgR [Serratia fonticola]
MKHVVKRVQQLPFIAFEINEIFPNLSAGKDNVKIRSLSDYFSLWLDGFGSGKATLTALYDGLFDFVKIDKRFYWQLVTQQGYDLVIDSLLKNINQLCKGVIVCGIEKHEYFNKLTNTGVLGYRGFYGLPSVWIICVLYAGLLKSSIIIADFFLHTGVNSGLDDFLP